jgi:hypothetical protein
MPKASEAIDAQTNITRLKKSTIASSSLTSLVSGTHRVFTLRPSEKLPDDRGIVVCNSRRIQTALRLISIYH